jgi:hypothetical protein
MNRSLRRYLLNGLGLLIFAAITVITIIIARGNRIDFNTGKVIETGSIRITPQPEDVKVFLNESEKQLVEKRLEGLDAGEYKLRIEREGFSGWQGTVEVKPGFITDIPVTLFPVNQQLEKVTQTNIDKISFDQERSTYVYSVINNPKGSELGIWRQKLQVSLINTINNNAGAIKITNFNQLTDFVTKGEYNIVLSPNGDRMLLANKDFSLVYLLDTGKYNEPSPSNQLKFDYPISSIRFVSNSSILLTAENLIVEYNIDSSTSTLVYYHPTISPIFDIENNTVYWLDPAQKVLWSRSNNTTKQVVLQNITLPAKISKLDVVSSGTRLIIESETGVVFIETDNSYIRSFAGNKLINTSPNGQFIVVSRDGEIYVLENSLSQFLNEITHTETKAVITPDELADQTPYWAFDSTFFMLRDKDGNLFSYDSRGQNKSQVVENQNNRIANMPLSLNNSNRALFAILQDGTATDVRFNLYKLDFTKN